MNYLDIIFVILLVYSAYRGFSKGLIYQAASLAALVLGILGAIHFSGFTSDFLIREFNLQTNYLSLISFAITFLGIVILVHFVARLIDRLMSAIALGFVNRLLGLVFSVLKMAFIISIILVLVNNINKKFSFLPKEKMQESHLYLPLSNFAPMIFPYLHFDQIKGSIPKPWKKEQNNSDEQVDTMI